MLTDDALLEDPVLRAPATGALRVRWYLRRERRPVRTFRTDPPTGCRKRQLPWRETPLVWERSQCAEENNKP
ncbi:hypothetical protein GCM10014715_22070 [Streptomyces spiralis]|uniref:Uncharacterized protein n=1 Tax=Streptomyces spiralis TaxID=66376 RepID=A0A918ZUB9_9ACTN|nr:hypothetical protein GCM10014715_22070 [Streptomyces spiralis]